MSKDSVGIWHVPLSTGLHSVEFEHGTATGRRVVKVDDEVLIPFYAVFLIPVFFVLVLFI